MVILGMKSIELLQRDEKKEFPGVKELTYQDLLLASLPKHIYLFHILVPQKLFYYTILQE